MNSPQQIAGSAAAKYCRQCALRYDESSANRGRYFEIAMMFDDGYFSESYEKLEALEKELQKRGQLK